MPRIVTRSAGDVSFEVDSGNDVYLTRLQRKSISIVDLDNRINSVAETVAGK